MKEISATIHILRDRPSISMSWLWFSCLALLFLLPPVSFAQSHLWQYRPFRANDTDHSGGDHICDLRRDSNADGKPDMLGEFVTVEGTVIVEPSTFESGGRLFWLREGRCGIPVYGEPQNLRLGDSVAVRGRVRFVTGDLLFPESAPADLGGIVLIEDGTAALCGTGDDSPLPVLPMDFAGQPAFYDGNLITLTRPVVVDRTLRMPAGSLAWVSSGGDSLVVYVNDACGPFMPGRLYMVSGVVMGIAMSSEWATHPGWCVAPRNSIDVIEVGCSPACRSLSWGHLKTDYGR